MSQSPSHSPHQTAEPQYRLVPRPSAAEEFYQAATSDSLQGSPIGNSDGLLVGQLGGQLAG